MRCSDPSYIKKIVNRCSKQELAFPQQLIGCDNHARWAANNSGTCCLAMPVRSGSKGHTTSISLVTLRKLYNQRWDVHVLNFQINKQKSTKNNDWQTPSTMDLIVTKTFTNFIR